MDVILCVLIASCYISFTLLLLSFSLKMRSLIKYINVPSGGMPVYETCAEYDSVVEHLSFAELMAAASRLGTRIIVICQRDMDITAETYSLIQPRGRLAVVCTACCN